MPSISLGKEEGHERLEILVERLFPGVIEVRHGDPAKTVEEVLAMVTAPSGSSNS
jgi:hypothetical protein